MRPHATKELTTSGVVRETPVEPGEEDDVVPGLRPVERAAAALLDLSDLRVDDVEIIDAALLAALEEYDELRPVLRVPLIDRLDAALLILEC